MFKPHRLVAPFSGIVVARFKEVGDAVASLTDIYEIADDSSLHVTAHAATQDLAFLKAGTKLVVTPTAGTKREFTGTVAWIAPQAVRETGFFPFRIELQCRSECSELHLGQAMRANLHAAKRTSIKLLTRALQPPDKLRVFVVNAEGRIEERTLKLGRVETDSVEVVSGLSVGERVVTSASRQPEIGELVQLVVPQNKG